MSEQLNLLTESTSEGARARQALLKADGLKNRGDLDAAAEHYEEFVEAQTMVLTLTEELNAIVESPSDLKPVVGTLVNGLFMFSDIQDARGERSAAEELRTRALELSRQHLGSAGEAEAERSRAGALIAGGRFSEALVALHAAKDYYLAEGGALKAARTCIDLADILQWLGDYPRALEMLDQAAAIYKGAEARSGLDALVDMIERKRIEAELPYYRGIIAKYLGRYEDAEKHLEEALGLYSGAGRVGVEYQWASVLIKTGRIREGLECVERLEPQMRSHGQLRPKLAALLKLQAEALLERDEAEMALEKLEEGLRDMEEYFDLDLRWRLEWRYGEALAAAGRRPEALEAYEQAIGTIAELRRAPLGYRLDNLFLTDKMAVFHEGVALAADDEQAVAGARFMDTAKSRTLRATLSIASQQSGLGVSKEARQLEEITEELDRLEYTGFAEGWNRERRDVRRKLLGQRADLLERLRFSDPRWRNLTEPVALDVDQLMEGLAERNQAALNLFQHDGEVTAVLLADDVQLIGRQELDPDTRANVDDYLKNLTRDSPLHRFFDISEMLSVCADHVVPAPLLEKALEHSSVVVIPHRDLHLLPWACLEFSGRRLFEYAAVAVAPNLGCLTALVSQPSTQPKIALVGDPDYSNAPQLDPLPAAAAELEGIRELYAGAGGLVAEPLVGPGATEPAFWGLVRSQAGQGAILHMNCHGATEPAEPMSSGLYLTGSKVDAAEIARAGLPFDEVVLSACSTGWRPTRVEGVELVGDDCLGLPGAFLEAGARSVLVSVPKIADEVAKEFMIRYHTRRAAGTPPLASYRQSQQSMLEDSDHKPSHWVGVTLYGVT